MLDVVDSLLFVCRVFEGNHSSLKKQFVVPPINRIVLDKLLPPLKVCNFNGIKAQTEDVLSLSLAVKLVGFLFKSVNLNEGNPFVERLTD
jgi:hypothetical protein